MFDFIPRQYVEFGDHGTLSLSNLFFSSVASSRRRPRFCRAFFSSLTARAGGGLEIGGFGFGGVRNRGRGRFFTQRFKDRIAHEQHNDHEGEGGDDGDRLQNREDGDAPPAAIIKMMVTAPGRCPNRCAYFCWGSYRRSGDHGQNICGGIRRADEANDDEQDGQRPGDHIEGHLLQHGKKGRWYSHWRWPEGPRR